MSAGQRGQLTAQMGHVQGTDRTQTRGVSRQNSSCLLFFFFPSWTPRPEGLGDAQNRRKRTSTHDWVHEYHHEWAHEWTHECAHESAHDSTHEVDFPVFSPSRTPHESSHETSHEGVHGRPHEWTVGVHLSCFHRFCSLTKVPGDSFRRLFGDFGPEGPGRLL